MAELTNPHLVLIVATPKDNAGMVGQSPDLPPNFLANIF